MNKNKYIIIYLEHKVDFVGVALAAEQKKARPNKPGFAATGEN
jgi:hypothetical protein